VRSCGGTPEHAHAVPEFTAIAVQGWSSSVGQDGLANGAYPRCLASCWLVNSAPQAKRTSGPKAFAEKVTIPGLGHLKTLISENFCHY